jgi:uncharacterized membrane protein YjdF
MNQTKICLLVFSAIFISLTAYALWIGSRYKWDAIFVMALWIGVFLIRDRINLHPVHYALFGVFLFLHFAGVFGWYESYPLGVEYDHWVHGWFGFVASLIVLRAYYFYGVYPPVLIAVATVALILGFSAFHELFEYAGAMAVGEGEGVLFIGAGDLDEWDTQKDMLNNLIGGVLGVVCFYTSKYGWAKRSPTDESSQSAD